MTDLLNYRSFKRQSESHWEIQFHRHEEYGGYYSFNCDEHGVVNLDALTDVQRQSWVNAHNLMDYKPGRLEFVTYYHTVPAHGDCVCGREVMLNDSLWNSCDCGRWYSMSGTSVISPSQYQSDVYPETGESITDIYNGGDDAYDDGVW